MSESNYTLKITLSEANTIKAALRANELRLESHIKSLSITGEEIPKGMMEEFDTIKRLLDRL